MTFKQLMELMLLHSEDDGGGSGGNGETNSGETNGTTKKIEMTSEELDARNKRAVTTALGRLAKGGDELNAWLEENPDLATAILGNDTVKAKLEEQADKEKKKAQGEYEKLLTDEQTEHAKTKAKLDELKGTDKQKGEDLEAYQTGVSELVTQQMKALEIPKSMTALLEGKTPLEKLKWLTDYADELGTGIFLTRTPSGNGSGMDETQRKEASGTISRQMNSRF